MYQRPIKIRDVVITPYKYYSPLAGVFEEITVYVVKGRESPDPGKRMLWGFNDKGGFQPGDFKRQFTRSGAPIRLKVDITECWTAQAETVAENKAIRDYIAQP